MSDVGQVVEQMLAHGLPALPAGHPKLDGKVHRFGPAKKGWYQLRELTLDSGSVVIAGAFGQWQGDDPGTVPVKIDAAKMTDEERADLRRQQEAQDRREAERRAEEIRLAAGRAADQWRKAEGLPLAHPYLDRKQVPAAGVRVSRDGLLLIPLMKNGRLMGLEKIDAAGGKKLNGGMDAIGVHHDVGQLRGAPIIGLGEGYATCMSPRISVAADYDLPVVVALNAGNLPVVARALRSAYPDAHLLLFVDDDYLIEQRYHERLTLADSKKGGWNIETPPAIDGETHVIRDRAGELVQVTPSWTSDACGIPYIAVRLVRGRIVKDLTFKNAGMATCHAVARELGNATLAIPSFTIDRAGRKLTDWNDLHIEEGIEVVGRQVLLFIHAAQQRLIAVPAPAGADAVDVDQARDPAALLDVDTVPPLPLAAEPRSMGSSPPQSAHAVGSDLPDSPPLPLAAEQPPPEGDVSQELPPGFDDVPPPSAEVIPFPAGGASPGAQGGGEGGKKKEKPKKVYGQAHWDAVNDVLDNFVLIYGEDLVWDKRQRMLMKISAMKTIVANNDVMKFWSGPARQWVLKKNIVFDPTETPSPEKSGPAATVNLFSGWKMKPKKGTCLQIRVLLAHLCNGDEALQTWIERWLAYPLRHPGAKLETSIVMHGDEGSGKNFFFEKIVKAIYGEYGYVIGNAQLESNFNDWASMKLFMVADEVVTRAELKQMKGKLKYLISGDTVIVNPKGMPEHCEKNQMNFVFLSNELQPLALDKTDRRYLVIWTPPALGRDFYVGVAKEIEAGGIEAFYHYLMYELDMGDFNEHTKPLYTDAKDNLIEKSLAPAERFYREWERGELPLPYMTCGVTQLYEAFQIWCGRSGESRHTSKTVFSPQIERYAGGALVKRPINCDVGAGKPKQLLVFLVGERPSSHSSDKEWAEAAMSLFDRDLNLYRNRGGGELAS